MRSLHLTLKAALDSVPAAGDAIRHLCLQSGVDAHDAALVELAVVEALQNTIEHGYAGRPGRLDLEAHVDDDRIHATIRDDAPAVDPQLIAPAPVEEPVPSDREALRERGRGLEIIRGVFDDVQFSRSEGRNRLALIRTRHRETP